jgi:hypothetical protein
VKSIPGTKTLMVAVVVIVAAVLVPVALAKHGADDRGAHARHATKAAVVHHVKKAGKRSVPRHRAVSREAEARHGADDPPGDDRGRDRAGTSGSDDPSGHR